MKGKAFDGDREHCGKTMYFGKFTDYQFTKTAWFYQCQVCMKSIKRSRWVLNDKVS